MNIPIICLLLIILFSLITLCYIFTRLCYLWLKYQITVSEESDKKKVPKYNHITIIEKSADGNRELIVEHFDIMLSPISFDRWVAEIRNKILNRRDQFLVPEGSGEMEGYVKEFWNLEQCEQFLGILNKIIKDKSTGFPKQSIKEEPYEN